MDTAQFKVPKLAACAACGVVGYMPGLLPGWSVAVVLLETPTPIHDAVMGRFDFVIHCPDHTD